MTKPVKGMLTMMQAPDTISQEKTFEEIIAALMAYVHDFVERKVN